MKFSCVLGTYNPNPEWLKRAIDSSIGLFDEIVIVDDGSTDDDVAKSFLSDITPIKYIRHEQNKGFFEAKNTAIRTSTGDIICILDDDDYFNADGVVELKQYIEQNPNYDVYHFLLQEFGISNGVYGLNAVPEELNSRNSIPGISWFKKVMWEELGGFKKVKAEDWNFSLRAYRAGKKFAYFPQVAYNMNVRRNSASRSWSVPFEQIRQEVLDNA